MCKPTKTKATEQARITDPSQQNPKPEPEIIVPPNQVPDPVPPNPQDPPAHSSSSHTRPSTATKPFNTLPNPMQPQNPPAHVPNPILPPAPPVQIPQLNWSYFKPEFSDKKKMQKPIY